ncbi:MAG: hypothetical protein ACP5M9_03120 [Candidatus Micrarchaeia archaeon]
MEIKTQTPKPITTPGIKKQSPEPLFYLSEVSLLTKKNKEAISATEDCYHIFKTDPKKRSEVLSQLLDIAEKSGISNKERDITAVIIKSIKRKDRKKAKELSSILKEVRRTSYSKDPMAFAYMARKVDPECFLEARKDIESIFQKIADEKAVAVVNFVNTLKSTS